MCADSRQDVTQVGEQVDTTELATGHQAVDDRHPADATAHRGTYPDAGETPGPPAGRLPFGRDFGLILTRATIRYGEFRDLRRTTICNWFAEGLSELEVMRLAGHADFKTTHRYYLKVRDGLVDRDRQASARALRRNLTRLVRAPIFARSTTKKPGNRKRLSGNNLQKWAGADLNRRHTGFQCVDGFL